MRAKSASARRGAAHFRSRSRSPRDPTIREGAGGCEGPALERGSYSHNARHNRKLWTARTRGIRSAATTTTTTTLVVTTMVVVGDGSGEAGWVERTFNLSLRGSSWLEMRGTLASSCSSTVGLVGSSGRILLILRSRSISHNVRVLSLVRDRAVLLFARPRVPAMSLIDSDRSRCRVRIRKIHVRSDDQVSPASELAGPVDDDTSR